MTKSIAEINERIAKGQAVVVTAEEVIDLVKKKGVAKAAKDATTSSKEMDAPGQNHTSWRANRIMHLGRTSICGQDRRCG